MRLLLALRPSSLALPHHPLVKRKRLHLPDADLLEIGMTWVEKIVEVALGDG